MALSNYLFKKEIKDLYNLYGVTISGPAGTISGYFNGNISLSNSASLSGNPLSEFASSGIESIKNGAVKKLSEVMKKKMGGIAGNLASGALEAVTKDITKNLASSIMVYDSGSKFSMSVSMLYFPGLFNSGSFDALEDFATKATLPKNVAGVLAPYSQYLYSPAKVRAQVAPDLSTDLFSLDVMNGKIAVPGGLYITSISRNYSDVVDEKGNHIYCVVDVSLEYFRSNFADEFKGFVNL